MVCIPKELGFEGGRNRLEVFIGSEDRFCMA